LTGTIEILSLELPKISSAHTNDQLPVVVGGTAYWLQHLLFANRLASFEDAANESLIAFSSVSKATPLFDLPPALRQLFDNLPSRGDDVDEATAFDLHNLLAHIDPTTAARWHWKDARKVLRSLNIIRESKTTVRDMYEAQPDTVAR
jgi:tRNA dimethylallyltransferase